MQELWIPSRFWVSCRHTCTFLVVVGPDLTLDLPQEQVQVLPAVVVYPDQALGLLQEQGQVLPAEVVDPDLGLGLLQDLI